MRLRMHEIGGDRKCESGKMGTMLQEWKMLEWKHQEQQWRQFVFRI